VFVLTPSQHLGLSRDCCVVSNLILTNAFFTGLLHRSRRVSARCEIHDGILKLKKMVLQRRAA
jgi:hypothetical protein